MQSEGVWEGEGVVIICGAEGRIWGESGSTGGGGEEEEAEESEEVDWVRARESGVFRTARFRSA